MKRDHFAALCQPELFEIHATGDVISIDGPRLPPFASFAQYEECHAWSDQYFDSPACRTCFTPTGKRNSKRLVLGECDEDCDYAHVQFDAFGFAFSYILSENFVRALSASERERLVLHPVSTASGARFFELVGPGGAKAVAISTAEPSGWRCSACGYSSVSYWRSDSDVRRFVAKSDIPQSVDLFTASFSAHPVLVTTAGRWRKLAEVLKGLERWPLGVLPPELVARQPQLVQKKPPTYFDPSLAEK